MIARGPEYRACSASGSCSTFYRGRIDSERIPISGWRILPVSELVAQDLLGMQEDVIYEFDRGRRNVS
jgi:hypothetical protein